jgi:hypothetical protein
LVLTRPQEVQGSEWEERLNAQVEVVPEADLRSEAAEAVEAAEAEAQVHAQGRAEGGEGSEGPCHIAPWASAAGYAGSPWKTASRLLVREARFEVLHWGLRTFGGSEISDGGEGSGEPALGPGGGSYIAGPHA